MQTRLHDIRFAIRTLCSHPGFTTVAIITLALGIGANTTIFSVVDGVLLRPLRFQQSEALVRLYESNPKQGRAQADVSPANFVDWRSRSRSFEGVAAIGTRPVTLTGGREPERLLAMLVTEDFFPILRAQTVLGRTFQKDEFNASANAAFAQVSRGGTAPEGNVPIVISHSFWTRRFGGAQEVVGRRVTMDNRQVTIIGVLRADFAFAENPAWPGASDCWIPQSFRAGENPRAKYLTVIARLKSGTGTAQAQAELQSIARQLEVERPDSNKDWNIRAVSLLETIVGDVKHELLVLFGVVGFVLVIACANIANLLLARAASRNREIAVRRALGAGRSRIIRQLITESVVLAILSGLVSILLSVWGLRMLIALSPASLPRVGEISLDGRVFAFACITSLVSGTISGLVPALRATKLDLVDSLRESGSNIAGGRRHFFGSTLVVSEIALTLVLLIGAGLMIRSFVHVISVNMGFRTENVLTMGVSPPSTMRTLGVARSFYKEALRRVESLPGVESAAIGAVPLIGIIESRFFVEGRPEPVECGMHAPSAHYFRVLGIRLLSGRFFAASDDEGGGPVAILNRTAAERSCPGGDPIGRRINLGDIRRPSWASVVGVVENMKSTSLEADSRPEVFVPYLQTQMFLAGSLLVRTNRDPISFIPAVKSTIWSLNKDYPITRIATLEEIFSRAIARRRFNMLLTGAFAFLALVLSAIGIYGVMAHTTSRRTREIGIRLALGAQRKDVLRLVMRRGVFLLLVGEFLGLAGAIALNRVVESMLFGVRTTDPLTYAAVALIWAVVAMLACYLPARRAMNVDPMVALRYE